MIAVRSQYRIHPRIQSFRCRYLKSIRNLGNLRNFGYLPWLEKTRMPLQKLNSPAVFDTLDMASPSNGTRNSYIPGCIDTTDTFLQFTPSIHRTHSIHSIELPLIDRTETSLIQQTHSLLPKPLAAPRNFPRNVCPQCPKSQLNLIVNILEQSRLLQPEKIFHFHL